MNVGIDLGTTFSMISHVNPHGVPALFPDVHDSNQFQTPSVVHIGSLGGLVGKSVEDLLEDEPATPVARFAKLHMGSDEIVYRDHRRREWKAEAVAAIVLKKLLRDAQAFANEEVAGAVVCVPSQFGDAARRATRDAAILAGLGGATLVEEPVAAATYYGLSDSRTERTLFVYDLGGGTFDATLMQASPKGLYVLATDGARDIGGKRFDEKIMGAVAEEFRRTHGIDPIADPASHVQLRRFAERVKIQLGKPGKGQVRQSILLCGKPYDFLMTRTQFEVLIAPLVEETLSVCKRCLTSASLGWNAVDRILLVGGSTLVPCVQQRVREVSGKAGDQVMQQQPHHAVSYGAALIAARTGGSSAAPSLVQRIASYDLGIRVWDALLGKPGVNVLIRRNTPLPAKAKTTVYTTRPDQTRMILEIVQAKGTDEPVSLGNFAFGPITQPRKNYPVEISVAYDLEGLVKIAARDPRTGQEMERMLEDPAQAETARLARLRELVSSVKIAE